MSGRLFSRNHAVDVVRSCDASSQNVDAPPLSRKKIATRFGGCGEAGDEASPGTRCDGGVAATRLEFRFSTAWFRFRHSPFSAKRGTDGGRLRAFARPARWRWGLVLFSLLPPLFTAEGQEALLNAVSLDNLLAAQSNASATPPTDRPHLGPVQLALGVYAGVSYDDNINGSQTGAQSDVITREGTSLGFNWPATDRSAVQLGTSVGYLHYLKNTANNGLEITPNSALTYALSVDDVIFTFYDQFSYSRQVRTEAALANVATLPQFGNTAGARTEWDPGKWTLQAGYGHAVSLSDSANSYLNSSSDYFLGRAGWRFAEGTQAGLEASGGWTDYQVSTQGNNYNYSVGGYVEWQLRPSLHLSLRGGPSIYTFESPGSAGGSSTLNSYYVSLGASHQLTDYISQSLQINRSVQAGLNQGSDYIEQLAASYSATWQLTGRISAGVSGSYAEGQQPFISGYLFGIFPIQTTEKFHQYSGAMSLSWQFTDHLGANLGYNHTWRDSDLSARNYSDNSMSFQFNYTF